jgi:aminoglycoside 6'-N-acetyltransferase I
MDYVEASAADLEPWVNMRYALWGGDRELLQSEAKDILSSPKDHCLIAKTESGLPIGFVEVSCRHTRDHTYGYLEGWYVAPEHRRHGIGTALIDHVEQWLLHSYVEALFSDTNQANEPVSLPAHAKSGYVPIRQFTLLKKQGSEMLRHANAASQRR